MKLFHKKIFNENSWFEKYLNGGSREKSLHFLCHFLDKKKKRRIKMMKELKRK